MSRFDNIGWFEIFVALVIVAFLFILANILLAPQVEENKILDQVNLKWQLGERHDWIIQYEGRIMWTGNAKVFFIEDVADGGTCWASIRHKNYFGSPWKFYNIECHVRSIKENVSKGPELVKPQEINVLI